MPAFHTVSFFQHPEYITKNMAATQQLSIWSNILERSAQASLLVLLFGVLVAGCSSPERLTQAEITVEGMVTARGNEPFVRYFMETENRNYYVLRIPEADLSAFRTPARLRATGRVYVEEWNGRSYTHLDVSSWEQVD